jgi:pimeloyl-ACP methyl ester carboxylesterase
MGGYAAFAFARRHSDRLRGLVLMDTRAGVDSEEGKKNRAILAERVRKEGSGAVADEVLPQLLGETTKRARGELLLRLRGVVLGNPPRGLVDALAGLAARADSGPGLKEIRVPTLVVCGTEDTISPPSEAEALQRGIAGSRLVLIPGAGHLAGLEQPEPVNLALREFLGGKKP